MAKIGLVLSGGMAKGAYQMGVLKAIEEFFDEDSIKYISAASIGSLNAYAYTTNKLEKAEDIWLDLKVDGINSFIKTFIRKPYIFNIIDSLVEDNDFIRIPFYTSCFNITGETINYIQLQDKDIQEVKDYLKASISLPVFAKPQEIEGVKYFDGALIDNIPVSPLMDHDLDYILVVHFDNKSYSFENEDFDSKLVKINFLDERIIKNTISFDKESIEDMIREGYEKSMETFNIVFKNGLDDLDYIYNEIKIRNSQGSKERFRLTGDVALSNINRMMKRIVPKDNS